MKLKILQKKLSLAENPVTFIKFDRYLKSKDSGWNVYTSYVNNVGKLRVVVVLQKGHHRKDSFWMDQNLQLVPRH